MTKSAKQVLLEVGDPYFTGMASRHLSRAGCLLLHAPDLDAARRALHAQSLHLLLLDCSPWPAAAPTFIRQALSLQPDLAIVARTGCDQALAQAAMDAGAATVCQHWPAPHILLRMLQSLSALPSLPSAISPAGALAQNQAMWLEVAAPDCSGRFPVTLLRRPAAHLVVSAPGAGGLPLSLPQGLEVSVGFGTPQGWYEFSSQVIANTFHDRQPLLLLTQPQVLSHQQRRRHARTQAQFPVQLSAPSASFSGVAHDISRGGVRLLSPRAVPTGVMFAAQANGFSAWTRAVWCQLLQGQYLVGLEFHPALAPGEAEQQLSALGVSLP